ncbi:MAG: alanine racemase [bacterium]
MTNCAAQAIVNLEALGNNLAIVRKIVGPDTKILAVIKADAYGHGMIPVAKKLCGEKIDWLGVSYVEEGIILRREGINVPILIMAGAFPEQLERAIEYNLTLAIYTYSIAEQLSQHAVERQCQVPVHIKLDTGLGRLGFHRETILENIFHIINLPNITVEGIFTHCANADDSSFTHMQLERFTQVVAELEGRGSTIQLKHAANSTILVNYRESHFNMVRTGIMLYGAKPSLGPEIEPVLRLVTRVLQLKKIKRGDSVGYGRTYICTEGRDIAVISIGYYDGLLRVLSNKASALIRGVRVPVIGTICMDMAMLDVTGVSGVNVGDEVVILGRQGNEHISITELAEWGNVIPYEILCSIGIRVSRIYT